MTFSAGPFMLKKDDGNFDVDRRAEIRIADQILL